MKTTLLDFILSHGFKAWYTTNTEICVLIPWKRGDETGIDAFYILATMTAAREVFGY